MTSYATPTIFVPFHEVDDLVRIGTRASQPSALLVTPGTLYCVTDEGNKVERSDGTVWQLYVGTTGGVPSAHHTTHEPGGSDPMAVDAAVATGSLRTLGPGAQQAAPGNDTRFTNARPPTAHASTHSSGAADPVTVTALAGYPGGTTNFLRADGTFAAPATGVPGAHHATHEPGGSDPMAVDAVAATGSLRTLGTGAQQATAGNDTRLTNARTPTAHQATHRSAGSDPLDVKTLGGYPGDGSLYLSGLGTFSVPAPPAAPAITPWTPVDGSGAGLTFTAPTASNNYVKRDRQVQFSCHVQFPATANGAQAAVGGLPHACVGYNALSVGGQGSIASLQCFIPAGSKVIFFFVVGGGAYTNANLSSQAFLISGSYMTTE